VPGGGKKTEAAAGLGPLPGGHHGLSREQVVESQRERLLAAVVTVVAANGYRGATVTEICKEASVSSRAFYQFYDDKEVAFLAAFDAVLDHLEELLSTAVGTQQGDWPRQIVAALAELTRFFSAEPELGRFCLLEPVTASPAVIGHFRETVLRGVPFLERGRAERKDESSLPASTEDSIIGGLLSLSSRAVIVGSPSLDELLPDLAEFALAPYLGADSAREAIDHALRKS
jgi:AcrR family transcriptional regulator